MMKREQTKALGWLIGALTVFIVVTLVIFSRAESREYKYAGEYEIGDTLSVGVFGGLSTYYFWPSKWGRAEKRVAEAGGMQFRRYALQPTQRELSLDWVICHIAIAENSCVILGNGVTFLFVMPDSSEMVCQEIVFVDSPAEMDMASTVWEAVYLVDGPNPWHRAKNGAYVAFLGFEKGSMKIDHGGGISEPVDMILPIEVRLARR